VGNAENPKNGTREMTTSFSPLLKYLFPVALTVGPAIALGVLLEQMRPPQPDPVVVPQTVKADGSPQARSIGAQINRATCAGCHRLFEPQDLSARSWKQIIQGLPDHFGRGEVRPVGAKQRQLLEAYLLRTGK
jgi:mono/diheme cytochrome c family protein